MITSEILKQQDTTIEHLPINMLEIDMAYQRSLSSNKVRVITANFNPISAGLLIVNIREDGRIFVLDGQHRLAAMKKLEMITVKCEVCRGLTLQQEARVYVDCNTVRKAPSALDVFRAKLVDEDPDSKTINTIVEKCGFHIEFKQGGKNKRPDKTIWAVGALEMIYRQGKEPLLEEVLTLLGLSFPDEPNALDARTLIGILRFHTKYKDQYIRTDFITRMLETDFGSLRRRAQYHTENGMHEGTAFARALQEAYNKNKRSKRLQD